MINCLTECESLATKILELIASDISSDNFLEKIASLLGESFSADACIILSGNYSPVFKGYWSNRVNNNFKNIENITIYSVEETREATGIDFVQEELSETNLNNLAKQLEWDSIIYINTYYEGKANSLIALGNYQGYEWNQTEKSCLKKLSLLLGIATQLHEKEKKRSQYQSFLYNISREIERGNNLKKILRLSLSGLGASLNLNQGMILHLTYQDIFFIYNQKHQLPEATVEILSSWNKQTPLSSQSQVFELKSSNLCQKAWKNAPEATVINSLSEEEIEFLDNDLAIFQTQNFNSVLIVPLISSKLDNSQQEIVVGFIVLQQQNERIWEKEELNLVKTLGMYLSMAMIHQQTLQKIQSIVEERTKQLKWSLEMQSKLKKILLNQLKELQNLNSIKDQFIDRLSDELRHPLSRIKMAIAMLRLTYTNERISNYLDILDEECNKEVALINDLLTFQQIKFAQVDLDYQSIKISHIIEKASKVFEEDWKNEQIRLSINYPEDLDLNIYTDETSLDRIVKELLNNAGKFAPPDTEVNISVEATTQGEKPVIRIMITNVGREISPKEQVDIFEPFYQGDEKNRGTSQGTGLGLFFVKSLTEHLNGTIEVDSQPTGDNNLFLTRFTVTLPILSSE